MVVLVISIHALREEGDRVPSVSLVRILHFYPRPPRGGRHKALERELVWTKISIHALREEGDPSFGSIDIKSCLFLSTPSARRATAR